MIRFMVTRSVRAGIHVLAMLVLPCALAHALVPGLPGDAGNIRQKPLSNRFGAPVRDPEGRPISYAKEEIQRQAANAAQPDETTAQSLADGSVRTATSPTATLWAYPFFLNGIGSSNLVTADNNGRVEIYAGGGTTTFGGNAFWHALSYDPVEQDYTSVYVSPTYSASIKRIAVGDVMGNPNKEIVVGLDNGQVYIYDIATKTQLAQLTTVSGLAGMKIANVDGLGKEEIVICTSANLYVYSSAYSFTGLLWSTTGAGGVDLAIGQMDADAAMEIAVSGGAVVDAATHLVQWNKGSTFGAILDRADIDGDGKQELIAAEAWYFVWAYDVDTQLPKWSNPTDQDVDAMFVLDIDADGIYEVLVGDGQWGDVYAFNSVTLAREWGIANPEAGVTSIAVADVDGDGATEVLWGSGYSSTGADYLLIGNWHTQAIEWRSICLDGPVIGPVVGDLDGDGEDEVVIASYESDSGYGSSRILVFDALTMRLRAMSNEIIGGSAWTGLHDLKLRDVDGDNRQEILVAADYVYDGVIEIYDFNPDDSFTKQWTNTVRPKGSPFHSVEACDLDGDGAMEIVGGGGMVHTGAAGVFMYVYDYATKAEEWHSFNLGSSWSSITGLAVGYFDQDASREVVAVVSGGSAYVFDGTSHAAEATITGTFSAVQGAGNSIVFGDTAGYVDIYAWTGSSYTRGYHTKLGAARIDGMVIDSLNPFALWVSSNGTLSAYISGVLQSSASGYGTPFGSRYCSQRAAGAYSLNAFVLPAPAFKPEPAVTPGTLNQLDWTRVAGANEYYVEVSTDPTMSSITAASGWTTQYSHVFPMDTAATYYYRVKARNTATLVESEWSRIVSSTRQLVAAASSWELYD